MRSLRSALFVTLTALVLAGCSHRDGQVVGKWRSPTGTIYTFSSDNTFVRDNKTGRASGTWSMQGDTVKAVVDKVNNESYKDKTVKTFRDARSMLPPDFVELHSTVEFKLNSDGNTLTHKNTTGGKDVPYAKL